ncbi:MAG: CDP-diacylglycerol--glycerol-3-phosphate 3-phosphatidyltransferase [Lachnospiraceae bacterium]|nr:CDP-diacylglycerol--glycerol-3-phosphate 3-phosphatidyltransferase [Lachnospiraceae bacterium]
MNLPNKLTILRVILIPFFVFFLLTDVAGEASKWIALGIFALASITDFFDGFLARKYNLITNFGKFMDPLADKLLVCSALICFVELGQLPSWIVIVIIAREFIISGFRLIASDNNVVIAASWWGKFKTTFQIIMVILLIADIEKLALFTQVIIWISLALTIISLIDYLVKNKSVMKDTK